ncbi:hypothetical protein N9528_01210 [Crocinitomicaceae bacterium]|nr:hypothetical protein [Crocinitomicaceae bacterium]
MKKTTILLITFCLSIVISSCKKEGCTDANAINYNVDAKKDNGNCTYEGTVVMWFGEATSTFLVNDNATSLTYYVDGQIVGSESTSVYWTSAPDCGQNSSITITKDLANATNKSYTYSVIDQTGFEYYSGILNFTANTCLAIEL